MRTFGINVAPKAWKNTKLEKRPNYISSPKLKDWFVSKIETGSKVVHIAYFTFSVIYLTYVIGY